MSQLKFRTVNLKPKTYNDLTKLYDRKFDRSFSDLIQRLVVANTKKESFK